MKNDKIINDVTNIGTFGAVGVFLCGCYSLLCISILCFPCIGCSK